MSEEMEGGKEGQQGSSREGHMYTFSDGRVMRTGKRPKKEAGRAEVESNDGWRLRTQREANGKIETMK